jgi:Zn-dependent protease
MEAAGDPRTFLALLIAFIFAITIHEASHAFVADRLGDTTARFRGRLTLNPMSHLDVVGSLMLVAIGFGWGKAVPVNPINLRGDLRRGMAIVAAAGPAANLLSAVVFGLLLRAAVANATDPEYWHLLLNTLVQVNVVLAIFNLIPIPPLDGFTLLLAFVDSNTAQRLRFYSRQIMMVFFGILAVAYFLRQNLLESLLFPPAGYIYRLILGV